MAVPRARSGLRERMARHFLFRSKNLCATLSPLYQSRLSGRPFACQRFWFGNRRGCPTILRMRTFGGFRSGDRFFYGEVRGDEAHVLARPYWIEIQPTGEKLPLANLQIELPVAPSK